MFDLFKLNMHEYMENDKNMETQKNVSLFSLVKEVWTRKILFFVTTAITAIVVFVALFAFSKTSETLTSDFSLYFFDQDNGQYPDKSTFNFNRIVSYERLEALKNSDSKFSNIDIAKMDARKDITIKSVVFEEKNKPTFNFIGTPYSISADKSYFKDNILGQDFILGLIDLELAEIENRTRTNLADYIDKPITTNLEYIAYIGLLKSQYDEIITNYTNIVTSGIATMTTNGERIIDLINIVKREFDDGMIFEILSLEVEMNKYVRDSSKRQLDADIYALELKYELLVQNVIDLKTAIDALPDFSIDSYGFYQEQIVLRNETFQKLEILKDIRDDSNYDTEVFEAELAERETRLIELSREYGPTYVEAVNDKISLSFIGETNPMAVQKPISTILTVLISVVFGLGAGCLGVYFKYQSMKEKFIEAEKTK